MRKLTKEEQNVLCKLSEVETTFLKCVDAIAENVSNKDAFYFAALSSLCHFFITRLHGDSMEVLGNVYVHLKHLEEDLNNERFN